VLFAQPAPAICFCCCRYNIGGLHFRLRPLIARTFLDLSFFTILTIASWDGNQRFLPSPPTHAVILTCKSKSPCAVASFPPVILIYLALNFILFYYRYFIFILFLFFFRLIPIPDRNSFHVHSRGEEAGGRRGRGLVGIQKPEPAGSVSNPRRRCHSCGLYYHHARLIQ